MIIKNYSYLTDNGFSVGDTIWACAFKYTYSKDGMRFSQTPIHGMLTVGNTEASHNARLGRGVTNPSHFVPFKKDGKSLSWSKAVEISSRKFATTEKECAKLYNELVNECISWHTIEIEELKKMFV